FCEALTPTCPGCRTAYVRAEGCLALLCTVCSTHFCAICRERARDERNVHDHVRKCKWNPSPGDMFCSAESEAKARRQLAREQMAARLRAFDRSVRAHVVADAGVRGMMQQVGLEVL